MEFPQQQKAAGEGKIIYPPGVKEITDKISNDEVVKRLKVLWWLYIVGMLWLFCDLVGWGRSVCVCVHKWRWVEEGRASEKHRVLGLHFKQIKPWREPTSGCILPFPCEDSVFFYFSALWRSLQTNPTFERNLCGRSLPQQISQYQKMHSFPVQYY